MSLSQIIPGTALILGLLGTTNTKLVEPCRVNEQGVICQKREGTNLLIYLETDKKPKMCFAYFSETSELGRGSSMKYIDAGCDGSVEKLTLFEENYFKKESETLKREDLSFSLISNLDEDYNLIKKLTQEPYSLDREL